VSSLPPRDLLNNRKNEGEEQKGNGENEEQLGRGPLEIIKKEKNENRGLFQCVVFIIIFLS